MLIVITSDDLAVNTLHPNTCVMCPVEFECATEDTKNISRCRQKICRIDEM